MPINETSSNNAVPAVRASHTGSGYGVYGSGNTGPGLVGDSQTYHGIYGSTQNSAAAGVYGTNRGGGNGSGVLGQVKNGRGVSGLSETGQGVYGHSDVFQGVHGHSKGNAGVVGESDDFHGVFGIANNNRNAAGVFGGHRNGGIGVQGRSESGIGVYAEGGHLAGWFGGNVEVTGDTQARGNITCAGDIRLTNADGAEEFDIADAEAVEPGTVMVLGQEGVLHVSEQAYDKRVAGIVSGAGSYQPGLILDRQENGDNRLPIALFGKVFCKVDAAFGPVEIGDLLTTSTTPGHAMRASDPMQAFGAVIGKALRPLAEGQGLIPVLVALQ